MVRATKWGTYSAAKDSITARCPAQADLPNLDILYEGDGHRVAVDFCIPVLRRTVRYDWLSGYFSVDSLLVVTAGLAGLIRNRGRMRLIVGAHDVGPELREAYVLSRERAAELAETIGRRSSRRRGGRAAGPFQQ